METLRGTSKFKCTYRQKHTHNEVSVDEAETARAATEEDSVVNGDSCTEYVILHSDRRFLRHTHTYTACSDLGRQSEMDDEPRKSRLQAGEGETNTLHYGLFVLRN